MPLNDKEDIEQYKNAIEICAFKIKRHSDKGDGWSGNVNTRNNIYFEKAKEFIESNLEIDRGWELQGLNEDQLKNGIKEYCKFMGIGETSEIGR